MRSALTYCGLVDDFAAKHTESAIRTVADLNKHLIDAVLFGDPLVVNDGHLLLNQAIRDAVSNSKTSPMRSLVESGYVKILTRNKGRLKDLAGEMANGGINSAESFIGTSEYAKYHLELEEWGETLNSAACRDSFVQWPPKRNTSAVFNALARRALAYSIETETMFAKEFRLFRRELDKVSNRSVWEERATGLRDQRQLSDGAYRSLMCTANEAYQYHWGCLLYSSADIPVRVQTQFPRYLGALDRSLATSVATEKRKPIKFFAPSLSFAQKAIGNRWDLLADVSRSGHPSQKAKDAFVDALLLYYTSDDIKHDEMQAEARKYGRRLAEHFGHPERGAASVDALFLAPTLLGAAVGGPPGAVAGLAIGVGGFIANRVHVDRLFLKVSPLAPRRWIKELDQPASNVVACFELDPAQATRYQAKASRWQS